MELRHVGIVVDDMERMLLYYQNMGKVIYDKIEGVRVVKVQTDNSVIELLQFETMSESVLRKRGISHVAFTQDPEGNMLEIVNEKH